MKYCDHEKISMNKNRTCSLTFHVATDASVCYSLVSSDSQNNKNDTIDKQLYHLQHEVSQFELRILKFHQNCEKRKTSNDSKRNAILNSIYI